MEKKYFIKTFLIDKYFHSKVTDSEGNVLFSSTDGMLSVSEREAIRFAFMNGLKIKSITLSE